MKKPMYFNENAQIYFKEIAISELTVSEKISMLIADITH